MWRMIHAARAVKIAAGRLSTPRCSLTPLQTFLRPHCRACPPSRRARTYRAALSLIKTIVLQLLVLYLKANLENVGSLSLPDGYEYCIDVKNSTGDDVRQGVRVTSANVEELKGSRGTANFTIKWAKDARTSAYLNVTNVKGLTRSMTGKDDNVWVPFVGFECRGLDVVGFHPEDGFSVESTSGTKFSDVDLSQSEWVEYDEKLGDSVGIYELQHKIEPHH